MYRIEQNRNLLHATAIANSNSSKKNNGVSQVDDSRGNPFREDSPIQKLHQDDFKQAVRTILASVQSWGAREDAFSNNLSDWEKRLQATVNRLVDIEGEEDFSSGEKFYSYMINDIPVGVMVMQGIGITHLVTHPGTQGVGGALTEHAVQRSMKLGYGGKLALISLNEQSDRFYLAMGFQKKGFSMSLDPANSQGKWYQDERGAWKLESHRGKHYFAPSM